jgi:hypothetical protein
MSHLSFSEFKQTNMTNPTHDRHNVVAHIRDARVNCVTKVPYRGNPFLLESITLTILQVRIERIAQCITEEVECQYCQKDCKTRSE